MRISRSRVVGSGESSERATKRRRAVYAVVAGVSLAASVATILWVVSPFGGRVTPQKSHAAAAASSAAATRSKCPSPPSTLAPISQTEAPCVPWARGPVFSQTQLSTPKPITTKAAAVGFLLAHNRIRNVTRTDAVETTWQEYITLAYTGKVQLSPTQFPPSTRVWVACASGTTITNPFGNTTQTYTWVCTAEDAAVGTTVAYVMGQGSWPTWFTKLTPYTGP